MVLNKQQLDFFEENGYVILPKIVSKKQCDDTIDEVWTLLEKKLKVYRDQPETWEHQVFHQQGFFEVFALQTMWQNRENPAIYKAFSQLHQQKELWVSIDRVSWKRPGFYKKGHQTFDKFNDWHSPKLFIHHDLNVWYPPSRMQLQGILALDDTRKDQSSFACIPGFHKHWQDWASENMDKKVDKHKAFILFRDPKWTKKLEQIPLKKGDFIIFNSFLPHCTTPNKTEYWRYCQYITYWPACSEFADKKQDALATYQTSFPPGTYPSGSRRFKDNYETSKIDYSPPPLSELGKKLVGLESW